MRQVAQPRSLPFRDMQLAFDDIGAGPCVVLIHGHPFDRSLWQPQVGVLATRFRVVAPGDW